MLIQVKEGKEIVNVYVEQMSGNLLMQIQREDVEEIRVSVKRCVAALLKKLNNVYNVRRV